MGFIFVRARYLLILSLVISAAQAADSFPKLALPEPPAELEPPAAFGFQTHPIDGSHFIATRKEIGKFAETTAGDHEIAGFLTNGGGPYTGIMATHIVYPAAGFNLTLPNGEVLPQILYAPTTRPANGGCVEIGTAYVTNPGESTHVSVYAYDFCKPETARFARQVPVDQKFLDNYSSSTADGTTFYIVSVVTNAPSPGISANWNSSLYNFAKRKWDVFYSSTGLSGDLRGWSFFETWYQKGQCSKSLPPIRSWNLQLKNSAMMQWEDAMPNMAKLIMNQLDGKSSNLLNTNCFNEDKSGPASYEFTTVSPDTAWEVRSTGH